MAFFIGGSEKLMGLNPIPKRNESFCIGPEVSSLDTLDENGGGVEDFEDKTFGNQFASP